MSLLLSLLAAFVCEVFTATGRAARSVGAATATAAASAAAAATFAATAAAAATAVSGLRNRGDGIFLVKQGAEEDKREHQRRGCDTRQNAEHRREAVLQ
ncbi:hypothetical protein [Roseibium sp.]|uniref:hypothetical protein n=1 Tax=Roseibium sp. TaxID=1936156 RepID=UPI003B50CF15